jgi:release factor glutamine methyltransferase
MTIQESKSRAAAILKGFSETPLLDAGVLLGHILALRREDLVLQHDQELTPQQETSYFQWIDQRKSGLPVAYLTQRKEFMGLDFYVDQRVLIPRPDTEILVEEALRLVRLRDRPQRILDVCTGSGCIILSLAENLGTDHTYKGTDLSIDALNVAKINRLRLGLTNVHFQKSDLLNAVNDEFDLILSNPPYLTPKETEDCLEKGWGEPWMALDGGKGGLILPKRLIRTAMEKLNLNGYFMMEAADAQMSVLSEFLAEAGFREVQVLKDLAGQRRVIVGKR